MFLKVPPKEMPASPRYHLHSAALPGCPKGFLHPKAVEAKGTAAGRVAGPKMGAALAVKALGNFSGGIL